MTEVAAQERPPDRAQVTDGSRRGTVEAGGQGRHAPGVDRLLWLQRNAGNSTVVHALRSGPGRGTPVRPAQVQRAATTDVAALSGAERLGLAWEHARRHVGPEVERELGALLSPESLATMSGFAAVFTAAQLTPAGWVADAVALTALTISAWFVRGLLLEVVTDLRTFAAAADATSHEQLEQSGQALARAVARGGVGAVVALLSRALRPGGGRGTHYDGPPPSGFADLVTSGGLVVRAPIAVATQVVRSRPGVLQQAASYAVAVPPPGHRDGEGDRDAGRDHESQPVRGPEVFEEISRELGPGRGAAGTGTPGQRRPGVAGAVQDADAAGLVGRDGSPRAVDAAFQPHRNAPEARSGRGVTGGTHESAHIGPTSFLRDVPGYSRSGADTLVLDRAAHKAFDAHWKEWAMNQRRAGRTRVSVAELYTAMLAAIEQVPGLPQQTRNALAWRLHLELHRDLGLRPDQSVTLPYRNIAPAP